MPAWYARKAGMAGLPISPLQLPSWGAKFAVPPFWQSRAFPRWRCAAVDEDSGNSSEKSPVKPSRSGDSTDWISSSLSRRFGLGAGLAWVAFLAVGVVSEQVKTRTEVFLEEQGTRDVEDAQDVVLANGIRYVDLRVGGGSLPQRGDLILLDLTGNVTSTGQQFIDTFASKRSLAFVLGSKPYSSGMCQGLEIVLKSMKAGGKRRAIIPASLAFGEAGAQLGDGVTIPGNAELEYVVELLKVSIAPA